MNNLNDTTGIDNKIKKCFEYLNDAKKLIISSHIHPDGDAVGSALALYYYATQKSIDTKIYFHSPLPYNLKYLTGTEFIVKYDDKLHRQDVLNADTIFIIDLNETVRLGSVEDAIIKAKGKKIVIDHHLFPKDFADFYLVDSMASSTGELVYKVMKQEEGIVFTKEIAYGLYTAIMTDTGSFRFPRSTSEVHRIVAELIDCGADPVEIYDNYYNIIPPNAAILHGIALAGMEFFCNGNFCLLTLTKDDFIKTGTTVQDVEGIVEKSVTIRDVKVGALITQNPEDNVIKLSFRSKGDVNVRQIAALFGGGGHQQAAGAKIENADFNEIRSKIIDSISELF
ncbi:MAG: bifunctional oligoribonuclease/PAP phosphatase NrnA [Bacteroidota bacterium]